LGFDGDGVNACTRRFWYTTHVCRGVPAQLRSLQVVPVAMRMQARGVMIWTLALKMSCCRLHPRLRLPAVRQLSRFFGSYVGVVTPCMHASLYQALKTMASLRRLRALATSHPGSQTLLVQQTMLPLARLKRQCSSSIAKLALLTLHRYERISWLFIRVRTRRCLVCRARHPWTLGSRVTLLMLHHPALQLCQYWPLRCQRW
jgi:hypothetical protein